jgi:hypothetical protein
VSDGLKTGDLFGTMFRSGLGQGADRELEFTVGGAFVGVRIPGLNSHHVGALSPIFVRISVTKIAALFIRQYPANKPLAQLF